MLRTSYSRSFSLHFLSVLFLLGSGIASAQTATSGVVLGSVNDPSGASIPGATVQLSNTGTNATISQSSSSSGQFSFGNVVPGNYKLTVTSPGFQTKIVEDITVDVNKSATVAVQLEVGGTNEVVEVTA